MEGGEGGERGGGGESPAARRARLTEPLSQLRSLLAQDANLQVGNIHALLPGGTLEAAAAELTAAAAEQAPPHEAQYREVEEAGLSPPHSAAAAAAPEAAGASVAGAREAGPAASAKAAAAVHGTPQSEGWLSLGDTAQVWAMVSADEPLPPLPPHPDAQPVPLATHELPPAVLHLATQAESGLAAVLERQHSAAARDATLLRAAWPFGDAPPASSPPSLLVGAHASGATAAPVTAAAAAAAALAQEAEAAAAQWAAATEQLGPKRLVVLCSGGPAAVRADCFVEHPFLLQHAAVLTRAGLLGEEACAARGGCDAHAELWEAMQAGEPVVVLDAPCGSRKARRQLLSRLTKHGPVAAGYTWLALADPLASGHTPSVEEGWAAIL